MKKFIIKRIENYQNHISPTTGKKCRHTPTCSAYAKTAFERFSFPRASYLSIKRILRCNPLFHGKYDPVPARNLQNRIKSKQMEMNAFSLKEDHHAHPNSYTVLKQDGSRWTGVLTVNLSQEDGIAYPILTWIIFTCYGEKDHHNAEEFWQFIQKKYVKKLKLDTDFPPMEQYQEQEGSFILTLYIPIKK